MAERIRVTSLIGITSRQEHPGERPRPTPRGDSGAPCTSNLENRPVSLGSLGIADEHFTCCAVRFRLFRAVTYPNRGCRTCGFVCVAMARQSDHRFLANYFRMNNPR